MYQDDQKPSTQWLVQCTVLYTATPRGAHLGCFVNDMSQQEDVVFNILVMPTVSVVAYARFANTETCAVDRRVY